MDPEAIKAIEHNIFTPGNYFYNGVGHVTVKYGEVLAIGYKGIIDKARKQELLQISENCSRVPANGATSFYEACQSFWFVQQLIQIESSGHSISPGRFDQYMYPYYKEDIDKGVITREFAQELIDCIWVKMNDLNKCRDEESAKGFSRT